MEAPTNIKFVIVGEHDVGKTALVSQYVSGRFVSNTQPTIGAACSEKHITYKGSKYVFCMWDTAGQEVYRNLVPLYYRNTQIAFIVFDVTNQNSALAVDEWIQNILENCDHNPIMILVANKCDLPNRVLDSGDVANLAHKYQIPYVETSAKTNMGIDKLFEDAFNAYIKTEEKEAKESVKLKENVEKGNGKCCE